jgi:hypothetical protein
MEKNTDQDESNDRDVFGKVETPCELIKELYSLLSPSDNLRVYEPGVGTNLFMKQYPSTYKSYSGCEIKPTSELPPEIYIGDFFEHSLEEYDLILGNPPFRVKTSLPSTSPIATKPSQKTIWMDMVKRCWEHLVEGGRLAMILPCIWLKPDKAGIYGLFTSHCIEYLRTFDSAESNKLFRYNGQTPCCYVIVKKCEPNNTFKIWDKDQFIDFKLKPGYCIPTKNAKCLGDIQVHIHEHLNVIKVATLVPSGKIIDNPSNKHPIILGASYTNNQLIFNGLELPEPGTYQGVPKIILAHKRLPIPYLDLEGKYGIHGRDKYVILGTESDLRIIFEFLQTPLAQLIIKSFTIRMNYYEKYIFDYIPGVKDIPKIVELFKNRL